MVCRKLVITGMSPETTEDDLIAYFGSFGHLTDAVIMRGSFKSFISSFKNIFSLYDNETCSGPVSSKGFITFSDNEGTYSILHISLVTFDFEILISSFPRSRKPHFVDVAYCPWEQGPFVRATTGPVFEIKFTLSWTGSNSTSASITKGR